MVTFKSNLQPSKFCFDEFMIDATISYFIEAKRIWMKQLRVFDFAEGPNHFWSFLRSNVPDDPLWSEKLLRTGIIPNLPLRYGLVPNLWAHLKLSKISSNN